MMLMSLSCMELQLDQWLLTKARNSAGRNSVLCVCRSDFCTISIRAEVKVKKLGLELTSVIERHISGWFCQGRMNLRCREADRQSKLPEAATFLASLLLRTKESDLSVSRLSPGPADPP